jgi:hypothetical protein
VPQVALFYLEVLSLLPKLCTANRRAEPLPHLAGGGRVAVLPRLRVNRNTKKEAALGTPGTDGTFLNNFSNP